MKDKLWIILWNPNEETITANMKKIPVIKYNEKRRHYYLEESAPCSKLISVTQFGGLGFINKNLVYIIHKTKDEVIKAFKNYRNKQISEAEKEIFKWNNYSIKK